MSEPVLPPAGCLTDEQLAELRGAAPGQAPEALARHLATCERCQARALFGERATGKKRPMPEMPSLGRALLLAALLLVAMAAFFWSLSRLAGPTE
jgi:hypothetical protein